VAETGIPAEDRGCQSSDPAWAFRVDEVIDTGASLPKRGDA
jgi:hypothetical protein